MKNFAVLFKSLLLSIALVSAVAPCTWCDPVAPLEILSELQEDARYDAARSALLTGVSFSGEYQPMPICFNQTLVGAQPPDDDRFYADYLSAYFPKADVIVSVLLPTMCSIAVRRALHSLTFLLTYAPWRYFVNNPQDLLFESVHVSILSAQLRKIVYKLQAVLVDRATGLCIFPLSMPGRMGQLLLDVWRDRDTLDEYFTLIALFNDTIVHQLYKAIQLQDYTLAHSYNTELQEQVEWLAGSKYEQQYNLSARLFADLLKLLHQRIWSAFDTDPSAADAFDLVPQYVPFTLDTVAVGGVGQSKRFLDSFIDHYEVNITGKFTHEYHPIVLEETARSFSQLEKELTQHELPIIGRLTLMGYEEQGVTQYQTRYTDALFSDEMTQKTAAGWSTKMFNRFGLLTGFLCKDVAALNRELNGTLPVTHIDADQIEIFEGTGTIFQEHAFSEAFKPTMKAYGRAQQFLLKKSLPHFFSECMQFWQTLYSQELKAAGKQHVVGTQDILFSIAYMRYVRQSAVPVLHFYVGPDITYPIETSLLHNKESTRHAQQFVKTFVPQLKPINDKKTAYVFCSFVDGVGKSTMLGNVQNMMKHGDAVERYDHVDNSSSQFATVFDYSSDVVIADLPAQVSHFTYKPDGVVYVDCGALLSADELSQVQEYVHKNYVSLSHDFGKLLVQAEQWTAYDLEKSEQENPELSYALTLHLLDKTATNKWISFKYNDEYYVFDADHISSVRKRVPLATAPSHGLKNCCPEQMIFTVGVRFPMAYSYFLQDLVKQLKNKKVEQVVMVDFISMYSRSSRENIRVNYVVQQLALLNKQFSLAHSFYQDFVHNAQLLAILDAPGKEKFFIDSLKQESLVRLALFDMLIEHATTHVDGVDLSTLTTRLKDRIAQYDPAVVAYAQQRVTHKVIGEHDRLFNAYGMSREYVTLQQCNPVDLVSVSAGLVECMTEQVVSPTINKLWEFGVNATVVYADTIRHDSMTGMRTAMLDTGTIVEVLGHISQDCHDRQELLSLIRITRARWHAACANLLYSRQQGEQVVIQEKFPVIPVIVLPDSQGKLCFVQPILDEPESIEEVELPEYSFFGIEDMSHDAQHYRVYENRLYLHDWSGVVHSHGGVFAYGHELSSEPIEQQGFRSAIVSNLYTQFGQAHGADKVLVTSMLEQMMNNKKQSFQANYDRWLKESSRNGYMPDDAPVPVMKGTHNKKGLDHATVYKIADEQRAGVQLYIRAVATIDMYIKDLDADFAVRRNNKDDFISHITLIERITLPWLFGLFSAEKLFRSYDDVMPLCDIE